MEIIDISGYLVEEKIQIARRHLIPKQLEAHGLKKKDLRFTSKALENVIENYTRESGVRQLDKNIAKLIRVIARRIAFEEEYPRSVKPSNIIELLGPPKFQREKYEDNKFAGVVTGLAWTASGGEILFVETSLSKGKGNLTLTGNLGEVMKESAVIALEYIKSNSSRLNLNPDIFENWNFHVHIPEGAIPKDGPSAGITMAVSIASALTQRKVRRKLAMTGEITLRGKVLPVGGIKEKILAAKRAGITDIIMSEENEKDVKEIKNIYTEGLNIHYIDNIMQVLETALLNEKVENALEIV